MSIYDVKPHPRCPECKGSGRVPWESDDLPPGTNGCWCTAPEGDRPKSFQKHLDEHTKLLPIGEALQLTTAMAVMAQIRIRRDLRATMVGQLYPGIVFDEECSLHEKLVTFTNESRWAAEKVDAAWIYAGAERDAKYDALGQRLIDAARGVSGKKP